MTSSSAKPKLSRESIADAALEIVMAEGVSGFTMRALGEQLGVDPMAAYRHYANKGEILQAAADRVLGGVPPAPAEGPWQERLTTYAVETLAVLRAHAPLARSIAANPPLGPASLHVANTILELLDDGGFAIDVATRTMQSIISLIVGNAASEVESDHVGTARMDLVRHAFAHAPPELAHLRRAAETIDAPDGDSRQLRWSMELLLAGLEATTRSTGHREDGDAS